MLYGNGARDVLTNLFTLLCCFSISVYAFSSVVVSLFIIIFVCFDSDLFSFLLLQYY